MKRIYSLKTEIFRLAVLGHHRGMDICYLRMTDIERIMTIFGQCYNLLNNKFKFKVGEKREKYSIRIYPKMD